MVAGQISPSSYCEIERKKPYPQQKSKAKRPLVYPSHLENPENAVKSLSSQQRPGALHFRNENIPHPSSPICKPEKSTPDPQL